MWELAGTIIVQGLVAAFVLGKLAQRVSDHERRIGHVETQLEEWKQPVFAKAKAAHGE